MAGESLADECCPEELAALVEHALLDDLVRPQQQCLGNRQPKGFGGLEIDDQLKLRGLLDGRSAGLAPRRILST